LPTGDAKSAVSAIKLWQQEYLREQKKQAAMMAGTAAQSCGIIMPCRTTHRTLCFVCKSDQRHHGLHNQDCETSKEANELERYLATVTKIDGNIFKISPLVGAYYVLNASLSTISRHLVPFTSPTFQVDTEYLTAIGCHIRPTYLIQKS
jgi:hypothetical protein